MRCETLECPVEGGQAGPAATCYIFCWLLMRVFIELFSVVANFEPTWFLRNKLVKCILDFNFTIYAVCIYWKRLQVRKDLSKSSPADRTKTPIIFIRWLSFVGSYFFAASRDLKLVRIYKRQRTCSNLSATAAMTHTHYAVNAGLKLTHFLAISPV